MDGTSRGSRSKGGVESRPGEAIEHFEAAFAQFCHVCPLPGLALAHEAAGDRDLAIEAHRRYVGPPYSDRFLPYTYRQGQILGPEYERLGRPYDEAGDAENAARYYAAFVELWTDAGCGAPAPGGLGSGPSGRDPGGARVRMGHGSEVAR